MFRISRWKHPTMASGIALAALSLALAVTAPAEAKTITAVMHSDLRVIDPGFTTAYITRDHGYMIYDTLFSTDEKNEVKPQMVDKYEVSPDKTLWTFTLRDGLEWHDGQPVTAEDCAAEREMELDNDYFLDEENGVDKRGVGGR